MKKVFKNFVLPTLLGVLAVIFIGMGCTRTTTPEEEEEEEEGGETPPEISVISPMEKAVFYTVGGEDTPRFIDIVAKFEAEGDGDLELSHAIIYNQLDSVVKTYPPFPKDSIGVYNVKERFVTSKPGKYKIVFTAVNLEGTETTAIISQVTCVYSALPDETDTN